MEIFEITGYQSGINTAGVNFLQPADSFQEIEDGFIYRQVLQSRKGFGYFAPRLTNGTRVLGIFEFIKPTGARELLVFDTNDLYKYNTSTDAFVKIPFGGTLASSSYAGFNITSENAYISGAAYPSKTNTARFVFVGSEITAAASGSSIFFYDGTNVLDYTNVTDNPDYVQPLDGAMTRANRVVYFNERLNIVSPTITTERNQSIYFSGIKDSAGSGDDFAAAGAGTITFSTAEAISSVAELGQELIVLFDDSTRVLEITSDAFNPYRLRNVPSVIGTTAPFSQVAWGNKIVSIGKDGIIETDGRKSLRVDNKIPYFTRNNIGRNEFDATYGGYDRENGQFLWTYCKSSEDDVTTQDGVLVRNYEEDTWSTFNLRLTVFGSSVIGDDLTWDDIDETSGNPTWSSWDTTEELWNKIGIGNNIEKTLAGDDLGFIYELNRDNDDYTSSISAITQATSAVLTVSASAFQPGDFVSVSNVVGMDEINNFDPDTNEFTDLLYEVESATATSITLNVDSSLFDAYVSGGLVSKPIQFRAKTNPLNPYRSIGRRFFVSEVEFLIEITGGGLQVDVIANESDDSSKEDSIVKTTVITQSKQWVTMSVNEEADFITFIFKQTSPSVQVKINSVRIHGEPGGYTSG